MSTHDVDESVTMSREWYNHFLSERNETLIAIASLQDAVAFLESVAFDRPLREVPEHKVTQYASQGRAIKRARGEKRRNTTPPPAAKEDQ